MEFTDQVRELFIPDTACRYYSSGNGWKNAPVLCRREHIRAGKCASCGFNPLVKLCRLAGSYGVEAAYDALVFSEAQSIKYRSEMAEGGNKWKQ